MQRVSTGCNRGRAGRAVCEYRGMLARQITRCHARDVACPQRHQPVEILETEAPIPCTLPFSNEVCLPFHRLQAAQHAGFDNALRAIQLVRSNLTRYAGDGFENRAQRGVRIVRIYLCTDPENPQLCRRVIVCAHATREARVANVAVKPGGTPLSEYYGEEIQRRCIFMQR